MIRRDRFGRKITTADSDPGDVSTEEPGADQGELSTAPASGGAEDHPAEATKQPHGEHRFEVSTGPETGGSSGLTMKVLKIVGLCAVVAVLIQAGWYLTHRPDPHYLQAEKLVNDYEIGRPKEQRNYGHTIYRQALEELAQVDRGSVSFKAAEALTRRIQMDIEEFEARRESDQKARSAAADKRRKREAAVLAARQWAKEHPRAEEDYKSECDHPSED